MTNSLPDIDRLLRLRPGGEDEIIAALVAAYYARLSRLARAILRDPHDAEDAVQQVFVSAALNLERYQPGSNFRAWIYTIAVNVCRGMLRRRKTRQALSRLLGQGQAANESPPAPEETLLQDEASRRLWAAVERLDEKQRLAVLLRYQDGLPVREIAQALEIPEATVYTRLHAALRRLRLELEPGEAEPAGVNWEKDATR